MVCVVVVVLRVRVDPNDHKQKEGDRAKKYVTFSRSVTFCQESIWTLNRFDFCPFSMKADVRIPDFFVFVLNVAFQNFEKVRNNCDFWRSLGMTLISYGAPETFGLDSGHGRGSVPVFPSYRV